MDDLEGKVAVVTGAASGIGRALADRWVTEGMKVVLADVEEGPLDAARDELDASGADVLAVGTDVSDAAQVEALAAATLDHFGAVHLVCNNAGVGGGGLIWEAELEEWDWVLGVNLLGVVHGIKAFVPHLVAQDEGHVVNTASIAGFAYGPMMGPYNASKAAVVALSETLKFELDAEGSHVGVSVLCPAWVRTNISTSDRNRPDRFSYTLDTDQMAQLAEYKARRRTQLATIAREPSDIADQVCDAVKANRFYVLTHPEMVPNLAARFDRIVAGENPVEPPQ
ncbi:MAG: SDR family NAD(P)-dependent oxidoreductase [Acidimicrobiales bacterium]